MFKKTLQFWDVACLLISQCEDSYKYKTNRKWPNIEEKYNNLNSNNNNRFPRSLAIGINITSRINHLLKNEGEIIKGLLANG